MKVEDSILDKLIGVLVVNSMDEFKPQGKLRPVLRACVASLIMYNRDVQLDYSKVEPRLSGVPFIHSKLRQSFIDASVFDDRALVDLPPTASDDMKAVATLDYWGKIIRDKFYESNPDFQPLTDTSNSEKVVTALNKIGHTCAGMAKEEQGAQA